MKNLRTTLLCACTLFTGFYASAQATSPVNEPDYNKPKLFSTLPDRIPVEASLLNEMIAKQPGQSAGISLSNDVLVPANFEGTIVSAASKYENKIRSVVIRSSNYDGATFAITRIVGDNGTVTFTGRIISLKYGDLYELKEKEGTYVLLKKSYYDLVNE